LSMANLLAGDIGGTTTRVGVFETGSPRPTPLAVRVYATREYPTIDALIAAFVRDAGFSPSSFSNACFGAAGPVIDGVANLTNTPVCVDARSIAKSLGLPRVVVLNDLEALAYAVPVLAGDEICVLQEGHSDEGGTIAIIAAGTGLGEAALYRIGDRIVAKPSEAGRADFAARTERDIVVLRALTREYGRAAVEHVVSGSGLANIHKALSPDGCGAGIDLTATDAPAEIVSSAITERCPTCRETLDVFVEAYGAEAGNLALRTVATGGVFVGGGIAPKILRSLIAGPFLTAFRSKPPFTPLLQSIAVKVIVNAEAGLVGAAQFCSIT
jgi:glucokinase